MLLNGVKGLDFFLHFQSKRERRRRRGNKMSQGRKKRNTQIKRINLNEINFHNSLFFPWQAEEDQKDLARSKKRRA